jgi:hypothetical protein
LQELFKLLLVEFRIAGSRMATRLVACRDEVKPAVLDPPHGLGLKTGFGRVALIVGRVDRQRLRLDLFESEGGIVVGG